MDKIERLFKITNYYEHPTDSNYTVFHYVKKTQADTFEELLIAENITFEKHIDDEGAHTIYLFGIHRRHNTKAEHLNFLAIGKHREPFIPNFWLRWFLIGLLFLTLFLAYMGYKSH